MWVLLFKVKSFHSVMWGGGGRHSLTASSRTHSKSKPANLCVSPISTRLSGRSPIQSRCPLGNQPADRAEVEIGMALWNSYPNSWFLSMNRKLRNTRCLKNKINRNPDHRIKGNLRNRKPKLELPEKFEILQQPDKHNAMEKEPLMNKKKLLYLKYDW